MGVPPSELMLAGAWIPKSLVDHIPTDCAARQARARDTSKVCTLRVISHKGAGGREERAGEREARDRPSSPSPSRSPPQASARRRRGEDENNCGLFNDQGYMLK